ncbi:MAG: DUF6268 family outer membrane beta-barrel protein [Planctomycetota bacterium]|nr:DUF6268 family outer membrane beta-barrel protein [Planctomycetota bacterium]
MPSSLLTVYLLGIWLCTASSLVAQSLRFEETTGVPPLPTISFDHQTQNRFPKNPSAGELIERIPNSETLVSTNSNVENFQVNRLGDLPISLSSSSIIDSEIEVVDYAVSLKFPLLKFFGKPPPIVKIGLKPTRLFGGSRLNLPDELYEYTIGISKVFQINERWTLRTMLGAGFATDHHNRTGDAWQFRGGVFGIFQQNPQWQWSLGAFSLGRTDLPVLPAIGAIWTPTPMLRCDLIPPTPKINFLLSDDGISQDWLYIGAGFNGSTWAFRDAQLINDRLTYRDWRLFAGWQSVPKPKDGAPYAKGRRYQMEFGYVFSRELELNQEQDQVNLDNAFLLRLATTY